MSGIAPVDHFVDHLLAAGFDFFVGVPCSLVAPVISELARRGRWVGETREDAALGVAAGAYLGGRLPVVIMQNSGLGVSLNALASLHLLYRIPCLLLVTWRGFEGRDAPEHLIMGDISPALLDTLQVPHRVLSAETVQDSLRWAAETLNHDGRPVALLLPPGVLR